MGKRNWFGKLFGKANSRKEESHEVTASAVEAANDAKAKAEEHVSSKVETQDAMKGKKGNGRRVRIYNLIIVDESGSMSPLREATLSGINETLDTIRSAQNEFATTQDHRLTLVAFNADYGKANVRNVIDNLPISKVAAFGDYQPNGMTPLYDALGQSLTRLRQQMEGDAEATAVVTVLTDGLENASREWNAQSLRRLIEDLKEEGWSFAYMGSAHNVKEVTDLLLIENVVEFSHDVEGTRSTWARESSSRRSYFQRFECLMADDSLDEEERRELKREIARNYYSSDETPDEKEQQ